MLPLPARVLLGGAMGLLFVGVGAARHGPTRWSSARLLAKGRQVTATVVTPEAGGLTAPALNPSASGFRRVILPTVRLAFTLDGRHQEKTLRLREPGAEAGYAPGQRVEIYVAGRRWTRICSATEPNARGPSDQALGACMVLGGIVWLSYVALTLA